MLAELGSRYDDGADNQQVKPEEMQNIVAALAGGAAADKLWTEGLHVAGERFVVFKVEGRSIYGRKVCNLPSSPVCSALGAGAVDLGQSLTTSYRAGTAS